MVVVMMLMTRRGAAWFSMQAALHAAFASRSDWLLLAGSVGRVRVVRNAMCVRHWIKDLDGVGHRRQHSEAGIRSIIEPDRSIGRFIHVHQGWQSIASKPSRPCGPSLECRARINQAASSAQDRMTSLPKQGRYVVPRAKIARTPEERTAHARTHIIALHVCAPALACLIHLHASIDSDGDRLSMS